MEPVPYDSSSARDGRTFWKAIRDIVLPILLATFGPPLMFVMALVLAPAVPSPVRLPFAVTLVALPLVWGLLHLACIHLGRFPSQRRANGIPAISILLSLSWFALLLWGTLALLPRRVADYERFLQRAQQMEIEGPARLVARNIEFESTLKAVPFPEVPNLIGPNAHPGAATILGSKASLPIVGIAEAGSKKRDEFAFCGQGAFPESSEDTRWLVFLSTQPLVERQHLAVFTGGQVRWIAPAEANDLIDQQNALRKQAGLGQLSGDVLK